MRKAITVRSRDDWADVVAMFRSAEYTACLYKLKRLDSMKARLLKARALMRLNRDAEAVGMLSTACDSNDAAVRGEFDSLRSIILIRLGRFNEARVAQSTAREHLAGATAWAVRAELRYHESSLYYVSGQHQRSYDISVSSEREIVTYYERSRHEVVSVPSSRAALLNGKAVVDICYGRYASALLSLIQSVRLYQSHPSFDVGNHARSLSNLTSIMNDIGDHDESVLKLVVEANACIPWTSELSHSHFDVLREIGHALTLAGRFSKAFETFREASRCSSNMIDKLLATVDCIRLQRDLGYSEAASARLAELVTSIKLLDLSTCKEQDADTVLQLAEHIAELNVDIARLLFETYSRLKARAVRLTTAFTDGRFDSQRMRSESIMAAANGDMKLSTDLKRQAFENYDRLGMRLEASRVALELARSENGRLYRNYAREGASRWSKSSFAVKMRRVDSGFAPILGDGKKPRESRRASL